MSKYIKKYEKENPVFPFVYSEIFFTRFNNFCWHFFSTFYSSIYIQDKYLRSTEQELIFAI